MAQPMQTRSCPPRAITGPPFSPGITACRPHRPRLFWQVTRERAGLLPTAFDCRPGRGEALGPPLAGDGCLRCANWRIKDNLLLTKGISHHLLQPQLLENCLFSRTYEFPPSRTPSGKAGAVRWVKPTSHEFAPWAGSTEDLRLFGPSAMAPWRPRRVPGGQSGGSAAAVAAGEAMAGPGLHTGASIRQPPLLRRGAGSSPTLRAG